LTLFSIYRVLEFPGKLKLDTIVRPGKDILPLRAEILEFLPQFASVLEARCPKLRDVKLPVAEGQHVLRGEPFLISKSSPASKILREHFGREVEVLSSTSPPNVALSAASILHAPIVYESMGYYAEKTGNAWFSTYIRDFAKFAVAKPGFIGALGTKEEPAGKVRVFAMVDP